ncbi:MAG: hypothetical protein HY578_03930 [Nitrospinae bacterium]|nr:hypothetical protein [Nitrospinota bacterium]
MKLDQIGIWSVIKLEIIKKYASAYTRILMPLQLLIVKFLYIQLIAELT